MSEIKITISGSVGVGKTTLACLIRSMLVEACEVSSVTIVDADGSVPKTDKRLRDPRDKGIPEILRKMNVTIVEENTPRNSHE